MQRKLIRQGSGTLTLSLPVEWTKQAKLKPGQLVDVSFSGSELSVRAKAPEARRVAIDARGLKHTLIWALINNAYIKGVEEIAISYSNREEFAAISEAADTLLGMAIVSQQKGSCVMKDLSQGPREELGTVLRRVFHLLSAQAQEGVEAMQSRDEAALEELVRRDVSINKLAWYGLRLVHVRGHDVSTGADAAVLLTLLEQLGDEFARLFRKITFPLSKRAVSDFARVADLMKLFEKQFYAPDLAAAQRILDERYRLRNELGTAKDPVLSYRVVKIAELIADIVKATLGLRPETLL